MIGCLLVRVSGLGGLRMLPVCLVLWCGMTGVGWSARSLSYALVRHIIFIHRMHERPVQPVRLEQHVRYTFA